MIEGNTAWMLISTALVLFMTLPGLAPFVNKSFGGLGHSELGIFEQLNVQIFASLAFVGYSAILTFVILIILKNIIRLRVSIDEEDMELDQSSHSETAYN